MSSSWCSCWLPRSPGIKYSSGASFDVHLWISFPNLIAPLSSTRSIIRFTPLDISHVACAFCIESLMCNQVKGFLFLFSTPVVHSPLLKQMQAHKAIDRKHDDYFLCTSFQWNITQQLHPNAAYEPWSQSETHQHECRAGIICAQMFTPLALWFHWSHSSNPGSSESSQWLFPFNGLK